MSAAFVPDRPFGPYECTRLAEGVYLLRSSEPLTPDERLDARKHIEDRFTQYVVAADLDRIGLASLEIVICEKGDAAKKGVAVQVAECRWHNKEFLMEEELRLRFYDAQACLPELPVVDDNERFECTCIVDRAPGDYNNPDEDDLIEECDNCKEGLTL